MRGAAAGTITPGSGSQQNSQCTLSGTGSSVSSAGNVLTLTLALGFPVRVYRRPEHLPAGRQSRRIDRVAAWAARGRYRRGVLSRIGHPGFRQRRQPDILVSLQRSPGVRRDQHGLHDYQLEHQRGGELLPDTMSGRAIPFTWQTMPEPPG